MSLFSELFQTAFQGILSPRLHDEKFLGILPEGEVPASFSSLLVLQESAKLIRSLFFKEQEDSYFFLPCLPPEIHSGRLINIVTLSGDEIHMEWSKKTLKKVIVRSRADKKVTFQLQRALKSFRVRSSKNELGKKMSADEPFSLKANQTVYLDRFEK